MDIWNRFVDWIDGIFDGINGDDGSRNFDWSYDKSDTDLLGNPRSRGNSTTGRGNTNPTYYGYNIGDGLWDWNMSQDAGSMFGNYTGELTQSEMANFIFNHNEAQIDRDWQENLANTSYQRQVADMQAAGVNPALAMAGTSNGAVTPSGAQAGSAAGSRGSMDFLGTLINAILGLGNLQVAQTVGQSQANKNNAEANKINTETPWIDILNTLVSGETESRIALNKQDLENAKVLKDKLLAEVANVKQNTTNQEQQFKLMVAEELLKKAEEWQIRLLAPAIKANYEAQTNKANVESAYTEWLHSFQESVSGSPEAIQWLKSTIEESYKLAKANADMAGYAAECKRIIDGFGTDGTGFKGALADFARLFFQAMKFLPFVNP